MAFFLGAAAVALGLGKGGNRTVIKNSFQTDIVNQNIFSKIVSNTSECSASQTAIQSVNVAIGIMHEGCPFTSSQTIDLDTTCLGDFNPQDIVDMSTEVSADVSSAAMSTIEQTAGFMQMTENKSETETSIKNAITNIVSKTLSYENVNSVATNAITIQDGKLTVGECYAPIIFDQNIKSRVIAEAITNSLITNIINDTTLNNIINDLDTNTNQEGQGIGGAFAEFFGGIGDMFGNIFGALTGPLVVSASCLCLILIVFAAIALSPAGQGAINKAANTGSNIARARTGTF